MKKTHNLGRADWLRRYVELSPDRKRPERGPTDREYVERKKRIDLIADARRLGNELGEVWDA